MRSPFAVLRHGFDSLMVRTLAAVAAALPPSAASAQHANPLAPLPQQQEAQQAAHNSALNPNGVKTGVTSFTDVVIYLAGAGGFVLAAISIYKLWDANQKGEQSRESTFRCLMGAIIGSLLGVFAIIVAIIQNTATGR